MLKVKQLEIHGRPRGPSKQLTMDDHKTNMKFYHVSISKLRGVTEGGG